jgi:phage/plasmid-associated DNA primase
MDDIIKVNDQLYYYDTYWHMDTTKHETHTRMLVCNCLRTFFKFHYERSLENLKHFVDEEDHKIKKKQSDKIFGILCNNIDNASASKNILDQFRTYLPTQTIQFDKNPYLFCFENCAFDLQTGKQVVPKKEDYILQTTGTDYLKPTDIQTSLIEKLISQIFPDLEIRKTYLSILFSGMTGIRVEKFFLANGCGRNGKGLLNELFMELLGTYGYILPVSVLTSKNDISTGANPVIANCHNKRFILSREPEEGSKIRTSIIKEMTGGCEINARQLYSGNCKVSMCQTQMLECNTKPALSGTMNEAILERIVDIPFVSYFTKDENELLKPNTYLVNEDYKEEIFRKEHSSALFHILLNHKKLYIPSCITKRSKEYVMSSDDVYVWIKENYEEGTMDDIVKAVDLYKEYTGSEAFLTMSKEEKRLMTKAKFFDLLKTSIAFKGKYFENRLEKNGVGFRDRLHGWKKKDQVDEEPLTI